MNGEDLRGFSCIMMFKKHGKRRFACIKYAISGDANCKKKFHCPIDVCFFDENIPKNEILFIFICKTVVQL